MDPRSRRGDRGGAGGYDDRRDDYARNAGGPPPPPGGGDRYHPYGGGGRPAHGGNLGALPPPPSAGAAAGYDPRHGGYGGGMPAGLDLQNIVNTVNAAQGGHASYHGQPPGPPAYAQQPYSGAPVGYPPPPGAGGLDPRYAYGAVPGMPIAPAQASVRSLPPAPGHRASATGSVSTEVMCPSECAGKVIGHGGEKINEIQQKSGAHVKIQSSSDVPQGHPRIIYVTGSPEAVADAVAFVNDVIREHAREKSASKSGGSHAGSHSNAAQREKKEEMYVPVDMGLVGRIIGKGGETIRRLSEESGARLQIERELSRVMIKGDREACVRAKELILDLMNDPNPPGSTTSGVTNDFVKHSMPAEGCEGKIIGKGGESIRELCQRTGAKIQIDKENGTVSIQGKKANVDSAIEAVQAIIDEGPTVYMRPGGMPGENDQRGSNPGGGYAGAGGTGGYAPPPATKPLWETHKSPEGYTYYYNTTTGETQWDMPDDYPGIAPP